MWNQTNVLTEVAEASIPFSPSLCAFFKLLNNRSWGDSVAPRRGPVLREGGERGFPCTPQLLHGFADSSVSLSLPHHRTAKANY